MSTFQSSNINMESTIKYMLLAFGAAAALSSCDENSWNDKLDGFEEPEVGVKVETVSYTLTSADYTRISSGSDYISYATEHGQTAELAAIGANGSFSSEQEALAYLPIFLADTSNDFFVMSDRSAVKLTYNVSSNLPDDVLAINGGVEQYTVTDGDYMSAWGSDDDYISGFAPMLPASRQLPGILKEAFPDAQSGDYVIVSYDEANENPIFGEVGGGEDDWMPTDIIADLTLDESADIRGIVTAICNRGFILTDNTGSVLCYQASGFNVDDVAIGDRVEISATISAYGKGYQIAISSPADYAVVGNSAYTYPEPQVYTGAMMDAAIQRTDNEYAQYVSFTGKASVTNYVNFEVDGATASQGSGYQVPAFIKEKLTDGETYVVTGYFNSISGGRYFNVVITDAVPVTRASSLSSRSAVNTVETTAKNAIYIYNGTSWSVPANTAVLQPADYEDMGQSYGNLSGTQPAELLPIYLKTNYPYAQADDAITVAYKYYDGSATAYRAVQFTYDGSDWTREMGQVTSQFVRQNGQWVFDPSVVITLPYSRNTDPSYTYYMACVNWVFDNVGKGLGGTSLTSSPFIDYRGNAEFYSGASAYYGNVDVRAATAKNNAPEGYTGYDGLSDEEITLLVQKRFCLESMRGALESLHPDAAPVDGVEVTYSINFTAYTGAANEETLVYTVSAPGKFKYKNCTWFGNGEDEGWE